MSTSAIASARPAGERRRPWMKWFCRDWRSSAKLRMCGFAARGLWADLISLMAESGQYGFLTINGVVPTCRQLAGLLGGTEREVARLLAELEAADVYSVTGRDMPDDVRALVPDGIPDGVILSRRMVRDAAKEAKDRRNGRTGGNPRLVASAKAGVNPPDKPADNPAPNPQRSEPEARVRDQNSEAVASGDGAPRLFGEGVAWLRSVTGRPDARCRALIGRWRRDLGDDAALQALIDEARASEVQAPESWFPRAIAHRRGQPLPLTVEAILAERERDPAWRGVAQ